MMSKVYFMSLYRLMIFKAFECRDMEGCYALECRDMKRFEFDFQSNEWWVVQTNWIDRYEF